MPSYRRETALHGAL